MQHFGAPHPREEQQRIDQLSHRDCAFGNQTQIAPPVLVELGAGRLLQQLRESADVAERRPQIVRDRIRKSLQLLVHRSELIAPLSELADECLLPLAHRDVVELHRRLAAAGAQQREIVRHEQRGFRQNDEQQTARAYFTGNRYDIYAARRSAWQHPGVMLHKRRLVASPCVEQAAFRNRPAGLEVSPTADRDDQRLPRVIPQCRGTAGGADGGNSKRAQPTQHVASCGEAAGQLAI